MSTGLLSTREAAELLGVSPTSLKRWAEAGVLACVRTVGGHRRFSRDGVLQLVGRAEGSPMAGDDPIRRLSPSGNRVVPGLDKAWAAGVERDGTAAEGLVSVERWLGLLLRDASNEELVEALDRERRARASWWRVAELLGQVLEAIGDAWRAGRIGLVDEHMATRRLERALARGADAAQAQAGGLRSLLVTAQGEEHTLGLSLVELCLRTAGWHTSWVGRQAPFVAVRQYLTAHRVDVLALSASEHSADAASLGDEAERYGALCASLGVRLWLGGRGAWPDLPVVGTRIRDFETLRLEVERLGGRAS